MPPRLYSGRPSFPLFPPALDPCQASPLAQEGLQPERENGSVVTAGWHIFTRRGRVGELAPKPARSLLLAPQRLRRARPRSVNARAACCSAAPGRRCSARCARFTDSWLPVQEAPPCPTPRLPKGSRQWSGPPCSGTPGLGSTEAPRLPPSLNTLFFAPMTDGTGVVEDLGPYEIPLSYESTSAGSEGTYCYSGDY